MEFTLKTHRWSLKLLGIWPHQDRSSDLRFVLAFVIVLSNVIPQFVALYTNIHTSEEILDILNSLTPMTIVLFKLQTMRTNRDKLKTCLDAMAADWLYLWPKKYRKDIIRIMERNARTGTIFNISCTVLLYITALGYLSLPFASTGSGIEKLRMDNSTRSEFIQRKLPVNAIYMFDVYRSPIFELTYVAQCVSIVTGATSNFAIDSFLCLLVLHFCGQLEILGNHLEMYNGVATHDQRETDPQTLCLCAACLVQRHDRIIGFAGILEDAFNVMLLIQILANSILFCILGYSIIMNYEDNKALGIFTFFIFMFTMMFHLFLYSYVGEEMMEKSSNIGYCAYKSLWYDLPCKRSKPLLMLMARSQSRLRMTAGNFFELSFESYTNILKTSATYLSVLRAVRE